MILPDRDWMMWWGGRIRAHANLPLWLAALLLVIAMGVHAVAGHLEGKAAAQTVRPLPQAPAIGPQWALVNANDAAMSAFYGALPDPVRVPDILGRLFALGILNGVGLAQGDYRLEPEDAGIIRCHLRFPLSGDTSRLEAFIWAALKEFPALALEGVAFQRKSADRGDSDAEIRFTLFLRAGATPDASASGASR